jgi:uncharacterized OB-fold protein/acyl dehydratase
MTPESIMAAADRIAAAGDSLPRPARDPVNLPMIRNWLEAVGGALPDQGCLDTAPPAMIQVWTMPGLHGTRADDDPLGAMTALLDEAGYRSVVATNCDQVYLRPVKLDERLAVSARLLDVTGPKRTALGEGWFVTTRSTWTSAGEPVATMDFRVLKYAAAAGPAPAGAAAPVLRPAVSPDTEFFWAGTAAGELRVQRCAGCGALRHPPGPRCPSCGTLAADPREYVVAAGTGEVYSYVVHHHPPVPGKKLPIVIALVQLPEGVRMTGELLGAVPSEVRIGLPVRAEFVTVDDDLTLPAWRTLPPPVGDPPVDDLQVTSRQSGQITLPPLVIDVTPTFVIATALATRDFQDVHHDRDRAVAGGAKDIFLNILTTTGLVQRYVAAWAGPDAVFRAISVRLGVPCHPGDTLTFTGVAGPDDSGERVLSVVGRCGPGGGQVRGDHVTATVRLAPAGDR